MTVKSKTLKVFLMILGSISIAFGFLGIFLPVLPTTPFLLLSAGCYTRSSEKLYNWLISNKYLGTYIKDYQERGGIALKAKIVALTTLWISIGYSVIFLNDKILVRVVLITIAVGVTMHITYIKTIRD